MTNDTPEVGMWLYSSCSAEFYGEIIRVGTDGNGLPVIDIRVERASDIIDMNETRSAGVENWGYCLTEIELPEGVKIVLRNVLWKPAGAGHVVCNTPGDLCYRCTKFFSLARK